MIGFHLHCTWSSSSLHVSLLLSLKQTSPPIFCDSSPSVPGHKALRLFLSLLFIFCCFSYRKISWACQFVMSSSEAWIAAAAQPWLLVFVQLLTNLSCHFPTWDAPSDKAGMSLCFLFNKSMPGFIVQPPRPPACIHSVRSKSALQLLYAIPGPPPCFRPQQLQHCICPESLNHLPPPLSQSMSLASFKTQPIRR